MNNTNRDSLRRDDMQPKTTFDRLSISTQKVLKRAASYKGRKAATLTDEQVAECAEHFNGWVMVGAAQVVVNDNRAFRI